MASRLIISDLTNRLSNPVSIDSWSSRDHFDRRLKNSSVASIHSSSISSRHPRQTGCLVREGEHYSAAEMQSVYSKALADEL